jgi:nucleotide-binding universal stress UspA family protein
MQRIRHLLCPVDLSAPSAQALRYAAALSSVVDGDLTMLHVRSAGPHQPDAAATPETSLETFASNVLGSGRSIRFLERYGEPATEILGTAAAVASDVIVMGTHGRSGLQRLLLGSVAERVMRRSQTPVLVVPPGFRKDAHDRISLTSVLCAVDFSEPSRRAVDVAASIAATARARLVIAHALEWSEELETQPGDGRSLPSSEDDAIARINELLTSEMREGAGPEIAIGYGQPADEVLRTAHERHVDLVVLGIRRRNPIDLAVFGSTAQRLIRDDAFAVLTVT